MDPRDPPQTVGPDRKSRPVFLGHAIFCFYEFVSTRHVPEMPSCAFVVRDPRALYRFRSRVTQRAPEVPPGPVIAECLLG